MNRYAREGQRGLSSPCLHSTIRARPWAPHRGSEPIGTHPPNSSRAGRCCLILLMSEGASASGRRHPHLPTALRATARGACGMTEFHRPNKGAPPVLRLFSGHVPAGACRWCSRSISGRVGGVGLRGSAVGARVGVDFAHAGAASALLGHARRARTEWLPTSSAPHTWTKTSHLVLPADDVDRDTGLRIGHSTAPVVVTVRRALWEALPRLVAAGHGNGAAAHRDHRHRPRRSCRLGRLRIRGETCDDIHEAFAIRRESRAPIRSSV